MRKIRWSKRKERRRNGNDEGPKRRIRERERERESKGSSYKFHPWCMPQAKNKSKKLRWIGGIRRRILLTILYLCRVRDEGSQLHLLLPARLMKAIRVAACSVSTDWISEGEGWRGHGCTAVQISQIIRGEIFQLVTGAAVTTQRI